MTLTDPPCWDGVAEGTLLSQSVLVLGDDERTRMVRLEDQR
ncbi:hypothetical protein [Streptomyces sp. NPDC057509]